MIAIKNLLVATDFGPASETALRYGRALAKQFGARLHLFHATDNIHLAASSAYGYTSLPFQVQQEIESAARKQTEALLTQADRQELGAIARAAVIASSMVSPAMKRRAKLSGSALTTKLTSPWR